MSTFASRTSQGPNQGLQGQSYMITSPLVGQAPLEDWETELAIALCFGRSLHLCSFFLCGADMAFSIM